MFRFFCHFFFMALNLSRECFPGRTGLVREDYYYGVTVPIDELVKKPKALRDY